MINNRIFEIADELKTSMEEQQKEALKAISNLPEGKTKEDLKKLLSKAGSGTVTIDEIQKEITNILKDAS